MATNIALAYMFLKHAERGYEIDLQNGDGFYAKPLEDVKALLGSPQYDLVRAKIDEMFSSEYDNDEDEDVTT